MSTLLVKKYSPKVIAYPEHNPILASQPAIKMFKLNNKNAKTRYEICSKLTIKA